MIVGVAAVGYRWLHGAVQERFDDCGVAWEQHVLVRHARADVVRILDGWPDAHAILAAHARLAALC